MAVRRSARRYSSDRLTKLAQRLLRVSTLCAVSSVSPTGRAHINAAYFAFGPMFEIVWLSAPEAQHSRNLGRNRSVAAVVYGSRQTWGNPDRGIMLFGTAREVAGSAAREAEALYGRRFRKYRHDQLERYRFYRLRPRQVKLFDERNLGAGIFVTAKPKGNRLRWGRTDIYE